LVKAREWYLKSIEINKSNENLRVKAWNNLLRNYDLPDEIDLLTKIYEKFEKEKFANLTPEIKLLLLNIYAYVGKAYDDIGYPLKKYQVLLSSSEYASAETQDLLRWHALIGFGTHYDQANFFKTLALLNGHNILEDPVNKTSLARLYYLLGIQDKTWLLIQEIWRNRKTVPAFFVLLRDFYDSLRQDNPQLQLVVQDWLEKKENAALRKEPLLEVIWTRNKWLAITRGFEEKPLKAINFNSGRNLASASPSDTDKLSKEDIEYLFNQRLAQVSVILVNLLENKQRIKKSYGSSIPQLLVDGICRQGEESKRAIKDLELLREPEVASDKWGHFITKLNSKVIELEADATKETQLCRQKRDEIALLDQLKVSESPLCMSGKCPARVPASDVESIRRESLRNKEGDFDLIHRLVLAGAWATAEYYVEQIADAQLKLLGTAYLRVAYNDRKSAMLLLKEIMKGPLKTHAALFLAITAWSEQAFKKAQNYLDEVDTSALSSWEKDYLNIMMEK
jgi:hypothetical protein